MTQKKKASLPGVTIGQSRASKLLVISLVAILFGNVAFAQPGTQPTSVQVRPGLSIGENTVADIAQAAGPAVVNVEVAYETPTLKPVVKGGQSNPFNEKATGPSQKPSFLP